MIRDFAISRAGKYINLLATLAWIIVTIVFGDRWWTWLWLVCLLYLDFLMFRSRKKVKA